MQKATYVYKKTKQNTIINVATWKKIKPDMPKNNVTGKNRLRKIQKYKNTNDNMHLNKKNNEIIKKHSLFPSFF